MVTSAGLLNRRETCGLEGLFQILGLALRVGRGIFEVALQFLE